ncbi:MAG: hypothetical protein WCG34_03085, partial [Leptolinea sp.]
LKSPHPGLPPFHKAEIGEGDFDRLDSESEKINPTKPPLNLSSLGLLVGEWETLAANIIPLIVFLFVFPQSNLFHHQ